MATNRRSGRILTIVAAITAVILGGNAGAVTVTAVPGSTHLNGITVPAVDWVETTDTPSGISAKLPGKAEVDTEPDSRSYSVKTDDYVVRFIVYDGPATEAALNDALQSFAAGVGATIASSQKTTAGGRPALDARLTFTAQEGIGGIYLTRLIAADTHMVQLVTVGLAADEQVLQKTHQQLLAGVRIP
jgi:hypothetical protein